MGVIVEYHGDLFVSGGYDDRGWSISTWFKEKALRHDLTWIGGWAHYHRWAPVDEVTRIKRYTQRYVAQYRGHFFYIKDEKEDEVLLWFPELYSMKPYRLFDFTPRRMRIYLREFAIM